MKISILTPSFNSGKYIERAIQSVLHQDYDNWEHIVIDGGSTDDTIEILKRYPHLKWISEPDKGQSDAMNKGFAMSTGDIIGYLNADDYYFENVFAAIARVFGIGDFEMVVGDVVIDFISKKITRAPSARYHDVLKFWDDKFPANPVSYFYKRTVQKSYGLFPVENHTTMDMDFLFFAYKFFNVCYTPLKMGVFYVDGKNKTAQMNIYSEQKKVFFNFLKSYDLSNYVKYKVLFFVKEEKLKLKKSIKRWLEKEL